MTKKQLLAFILINGLSLCVHAETQWSVFEDLLWWHASEQPTSIWAYQFMLKTLSGDQGTHFTEPNTYFKWSPGVRVGGQYKSDNHLDFKLYWTHYSTKTDESLKAPEGQLLLPQFFNGFTAQNVYNSAKMDWRIKMNMLDAKVGYDFNPLDSLTIHPSIGIKGGTINQSIHSAWEMTFLDLPLYNATEDLKNNFSGLGPSIGLDGAWHIYKGFGIQSHLETALLWGALAY